MACINTIRVDTAGYFSPYFTTEAWMSVMKGLFILLKISPWGPLCKICSSSLLNLVNSLVDQRNTEGGLKVKNNLALVLTQVKGAKIVFNLAIISGVAKHQLQGPQSSTLGIVARVHHHQDLLKLKGLLLKLLGLLQLKQGVIVQEAEAVENVGDLLVEARYIIVYYSLNY
ncbi:hypothetical protein TorRG33x02_210230 [Trema orientale]|uniref:Uncharacterized protein n=1 Tax=Trema orientale TaxID=63057 RepID=A0A2P5ECB3_TREOI|nr:hypothetical protein TorRG33x02_210230 [Trema orientale]